MKKASKKPVKKTTRGSVKKKCKKHTWSYRAGQCKCLKCGYYLQPNGNLTKRP